MFGASEIQKIKNLRRIADQSIGLNDKRVANAIGEAFEIFDRHARVADKNETRDALTRLFGMSMEDMLEEFWISCYNTAQYERGLEVCDIAERYHFIPVTDVLGERAQFYGHLGEFSRAEKILNDLIAAEPDNVWHYIDYGDLYYHWQIFPERQDLRRAEAWYYKAFDAHSGAGTEDEADLIERLGGVCVERLRRSARNKLLRLFSELRIGGNDAIAALERGVYYAGDHNGVFSHAQMELSRNEKNIHVANKRLEILMNAYNLMPQERLDDLSPFQMSEYYYSGEHAARIVRGKMEAYQRALVAGDVPPPTSAEGADAFDKFQMDFMEGRDEITGLIRRKVVEKEQKEIEKSIKKGDILWMGFPKFRNINDLSELTNA